MTRNREALTESLLLAAVLGLAGGGAASDPAGVWFSFSPAAAALGAVVGWLLAASRDPGAPRPMRGLWAVLAIALGAPFLPELRFLTGPPLFAAAGVPVLLSLRGSWCAAAARALLPACLMLYLGAAHRTQALVGPQGDEPHYLIVAQSLILDGDLAVENDFAAGRYRTYHEAPLEPHYLVRGKGGVIYSLHAIGLSALLVPAFLAGGYGAASNFMALLCVLLVAQVRSLLRAVVPPEAAEAAAWLVAFSPPLLSYAGLIFTEVPAALCVATVLRLVREPEAAVGGVARRCGFRACVPAVAALSLRAAQRHSRSGGAAESSTPPALDHHRSGRRFLARRHHSLSRAALRLLESCLGVRPPPALRDGIYVRGSARPAARPGIRPPYLCAGVGARTAGDRFAVAA